jgi:hypothetical protein
MVQPMTVQIVRPNPRCVDHALSCCAVYAFTVARAFGLRAVAGDPFGETPNASLNERAPRGAQDDKRIT